VADAGLYTSPSGAVKRIANFRYIHLLIEKETHDWIFFQKYMPNLTVGNGSPFKALVVILTVHQYYR